ncbi:16S rRNA (cytosine(967)-C(5))-methyltransferase RsmB [Roseburia sp. 831b]|uniref:16S rRNA (cytosine(967)-C(5))-methyltransferase RsmB n=1 Tax=Roseburia sp. 831b TaxID=1261635 RepID=UPI0009528F1D|nr:16S rRNA (cytosine(967)-C(5))-methyltransferase RsmB [Roseburia sp. 831b]WVK73454.1 16S rRNA (cytosine(967)-C(5))-methyltransferase RsmB [Roseburia sp. 831b]
MTNAINIRELVLEILMQVTKEGEYSHLVIRSVLEKYQYLEKQERAFLTRVSEGTLEYMIELDYIINQFSKVKVNKMKPVIRNIMRMSVYQLKYMDSVPASAACNEAVKLAKRKGFSSLSGFVNGVLRNIARNLDQITYPKEEEDPVQFLSVCYSMPEWIVTKWIRDYGMELTKEILSAFLTDAPIMIRTNCTKISPDALEERLKSEHVTVKKAALEDAKELDYAFLISDFDYLNALPSFQEGLFYVQDISSMMVAEYADPKEGDVVVDVCAAPGGKSIHIAEKLNGTGMVFARDLPEYKVSLIEENIARHQLANIKAQQQDALVLDESMIGKADIVVADLPCSGLGVMRKKTDIKYKMDEAKQKDLEKLQREMLAVVHKYVRAGGTLLYSTCTINRGENEENAAWFLKEYPEFELVKSKQFFPKKEYGDGFFLAKFIRKK